jgi:hypothetical protein
MGACECLEAGAELAHAEGRPADAVRLLAAAARRREQLPAPRSPLLDRYVAGLLVELHKALGEAVYESAFRDVGAAGDALLDQLT